MIPAMNLDLLPTAAAQPENRDIPTHQEALRRTVIFLDIDGVLQPPSSQRRFKHDLEELRRSLADRFADEIYLGMDKYDLGAVCFDWDSEAVERLRSLCKDFGAGIVISSDWRRSKSTRGLQALFRVYELHHYVTDATNESGGPPLYRAGEVKEYLESHPEIERFVIIDDGFRKEFDELFPEQFVRTWFRLEADNEQRARQILSGLPAQPNRECPPPIGPLPPGLFGG